MLALLGLFFIIVPVSTFLHEFGHATGARLLQARKVTIIIGSGRKLATWNIFSIGIHLHLLYFLHGSTSSSREKDYTLWEEILIAISGPFLNLLVALFVLIWMNGTASNSFITLLFLFNCWLCVVNLLPFHWKNRASDGYLILKNIKKLLAS